MHCGLPALSKVLAWVERCEGRGERLQPGKGEIRVRGKGKKEAGGVRHMIKTSHKCIESAYFDPKFKDRLFSA